MKVAIYIDGITLFHSMKGKKFHFGELKDWLTGDDELVTAEYFTCVKEKETKLGFFGHIYKSGFVLNIYSPIYNKSRDSFNIHGVDIGIAVSAMDKIDEYDKIILVSGKHDFLPLCEKLTLKGKKVEIVGYQNVINNVFEKYSIRHMEDFDEKK